VFRIPDVYKVPELYKIPDGYRVTEYIEYQSVQNTGVYKVPDCTEYQSV